MSTLDDLVTIKKQPLPPPTTLPQPPRTRYNEANHFYFYYLRVHVDGTTVKRVRKYSRSKYKTRTSAWENFVRFLTIFDYELYNAKLHSHLLTTTPIPRDVRRAGHMICSKPIAPTWPPCASETLIFTLHIIFRTPYRWLGTIMRSITIHFYNEIKEHFSHYLNILYPHTTDDNGWYQWLYW
jgi:hypothetical protein